MKYMWQHCGNHEHRAAEEQQQQHHSKDVPIHIPRSDISKSYIKLKLDRWNYCI